MIKAVTIEDKRTLEGILNTDNKSIESLYKMALPSVIDYVEKNSGDEEDARDVFQDAIMALFRRLENSDLELTCTLKSYVRIICRNLWLAKLRNIKKYKTDEIDDIEPVSLDDNILNQIEGAEKRGLFFKHFDALGESCKKILKLYFSKTSVREIAKKLDTSESYVKKRKFNCKEKLVKTIQADPLFLELI